MAINQFSGGNVNDVLAAGQQGWDDTDAKIKGMMSRYTNARAGRAYASGDRQGAARMLAQGGNLDGARVLQGDLRTEQRQGMQDTQAAEALTYERGRDKRADARLKTADDVALAERNYTTLRRITGGLRGYQEGERLPQLQRALPIFESLGIAVEPFAALTENQLNNANLDVFEGELEKQWNSVSLGAGGVGAFNPRTGKFVTVREPDVKLSQGQKLFDSEGNVVAYNPKTFSPKAVKGGNVGPAVNIDPSQVTWK